MMTALSAGAALRGPCGQWAGGPGEQWAGGPGEQ